MLQVRCSIAGFLAQFHYMDLINQKILTVNSEQLPEALSALGPAELKEAKTLLTLLWLVYPNSDVNEVAERLLNTYVQVDELEQLVSIFEVYKSITDKLPWMGDYTQLQQENFNRFLEAKAPYVPLLTTDLFVETYLDLGKKLYLMFHLDNEASSCFQDIIHHNKQCDEAYYAMGRIEEKNKNIDTARSLYQQCISINENHVYAHLQSGIICAEQDQNYTKAATHYEKVVELEPFMIEAYVQAASVQLKLQDVKRGKQFIEIALAINQYNDAALQIMGILQWKYESDIEGAILTLEKGLDNNLHGDNGLCLATLGSLYYEHFSDVEKARIYYAKSLKALPAQADTLLKFLQLLETENQDYGAMAACYENYLSAVPSDIKIIVHYAQFLIKYLNDYELAKIQLQNALQFDANHSAVRELMETIDSHLQPDNLSIDDHWHNDDDDFVGGGAAGDN